MYRPVFIAVVLLWLVAMTALVRRDIWPAWTAQDPPRITPAQFSQSERDEQFAIYDGQRTRIGTAWGQLKSDLNGMITLNGTILLDGITQIPPIRVDTLTEFDREGALDEEFRLDVYGVPMTPIHVDGARLGISFPCQWNIGPLRGQASLDLSASRMVGDSIRPFNVLPKLYVGQSWRMQLLDPVSAVISRRTEFKAVVAKVTGKESIEIGGRPVECFVLEIDGQSKSWVNQEGSIVRQEVRSPIPVVGKLTIEAEEFKEEQLQEAKARVRTSIPSESRG